MDTDHGPVIVPADSPEKVLEVMTLPRSLLEILDHADELARRFEDHPSGRRPRRSAAACLRARGRCLLVGYRRMPGTSGEATRKRYTGHHARTA